MASGWAATAYAQVPTAPLPSKVTPPPERPRQVPDAFTLPPAPGRATPAPTGADAIFLTPLRIRLDGGFEPLEPARRQHLVPLEGRRVSLAEVFEGVARLEQAYVAAGYPLVRLVVPAQSLAADGEVQVSVVDGFIESVQAVGQPSPARSAALRVLQALVDRRRLRADELERRLLLAGEVSGLSLRSTLAAGDRPGGVRLIVEGELPPTEAWLTTDNSLDTTLGQWQLAGSVQGPAPAGLPGRWQAQLRSGLQPRADAGDRPRLLSAGLGWNLPLGDEGLSLGADAQLSVTHPEPSPGTPATRGELTRGVLRLSYPMLLSRRQALNLSVVAEHLQQSTRATAFGLDLRRDRYMALRVFVDGNHALPAAQSLAWTLSASNGLSGRSAETAAAEGVPLSRAGASPRFGKLGAELHWRAAPAGTNWLLAVDVAAQRDRGAPLLSSEQLSLDGARQVTGLPPGAAGVDRGHTVRGELAHRTVAPIEPLGGALSVEPFAFAAVGRGRVLQPTALEAAEVRAESWGAGLRVSVPSAHGAPAGQWEVTVSRSRLTPQSPQLTERLNLRVSLRF